MKFWYQQSWLQWLLLPFSWLFQLVTYLRRKAYQKAFLALESALHGCGGG